MEYSNKIFDPQIIEADSIAYCVENTFEHKIDLTFLDPPFNQNKDYKYFNDNLPPEEYWKLMHKICEGINKNTNEGGAIYFMQREKNTEFVLKCLRESGWTLQNLIIWKKKTSAVPCSSKFGIHYQVIAFATKGKPRVFNRLRISPSLPPGYKLERENGMYVTDVWDDIRELTSGYFAGTEALRNENGERFHKQQAPLALLLRIILSSTMPGDTVLDPFAGTGTTIVAAHQANRNTMGIEIDPKNVDCIKQRLQNSRDADNIFKYHKDYLCTENINDIWGKDMNNNYNNKKGNTVELEIF